MIEVCQLRQRPSGSTILIATHATIYNALIDINHSQGWIRMSSRYSTRIICHHPVVEIAGKPQYHIATSTIPTQMCDSPTAKPIEYGSFRFYVPNSDQTTVAATDFEDSSRRLQITACAYPPDGQHYFISKMIRRHCCCNRRRRQCYLPKLLSQNWRNYDLRPQRPTPTPTTS